MVLTDKQKLAINNANKKAKIHEKQLSHLIIEKFISNNIEIEFIDKIKKYIQNNTSMTTKLHCIILKNFIENPILKNKLELFPGSTSYNSYRKLKEDALFHNAYFEVEASDRVKYGSLNIKNLISGDPLAIMYGDINIFYKDDIKDRVSFLYGNSEQTMMYICTFKYCEHLLYHMPIDDINIIIKIIEKKENIEKIQNLKSYIEIQLHGKIDLTQDIEKITMSSKTYDTNKILVEQFINKYPFIQFELYG